MDEFRAHILRTLVPATHELMLGHTGGGGGSSSGSGPRYRTALRVSATTCMVVLLGCFRKSPPETWTTFFASGAIASAMDTLTELFPIPVAPEPRKADADVDAPACTPPMHPKAGTDLVAVAAADANFVFEEVSFMIFQLATFCQKATAWHGQGSSNQLMQEVSARCIASGVGERYCFRAIASFAGLEDPSTVRPLASSLRTLGPARTPAWCGWWDGQEGHRRACAAAASPKKKPP
jgi:hypothetical protein